MWSSVLDLLFPVYCVSCGMLVTDRLIPECTPCLRAMPRAQPEAVAAQLDRLPETACRPDSVFAMWTFIKGGAVQQLQHALKYGNRPLYGRALGRLMAPEVGVHLSNQQSGQSVDLIIPVPLHMGRQWERGYNQSLFLAEGIADGLGASPPRALLRRRRGTRTQTSLGVLARWGNVEGAFVADGPLPHPCVSALLVDDVFTTGATAAAATQALREAGVQTVHLVTLAYAVL